jgi:hypothetical protein
MYLSILAGCIPVIFEPSTGAEFEKGSTTAWAWRQKPSALPDDLFLDYSSFTVTVAVSGGTEPGGAEPPKGFLDELMSMPTSNPERFASLRKNLDAVAPLMAYSKTECDGSACEDAFFRFVRLLERNKGMLDGIEAARTVSHHSTLGGPVAEPDAAPATDSRPLKVYLLPVPRTLTDDVLECYRQRRGAYPWDESRPHGNCEPNVPRRCEECARGNGCSSSLAVESAQHASDIWMHQGLLNHGSRTHNDSEADVIFIPFYGAP